MPAHTVAPTRIRQSTLARYRDCQLSSRLAEDHDHASHAQARGTVFHAFAHRLLSRLVADRKPLADPEWARSLMDHTIRDLALPIGGDYDTLCQLAWKFAAERTFDVEHIVDLEGAYELEIGDAVITGRPDYLAIHDGVATLADYKTAWAIDPDADADGTFQLRVYAILVAAAYRHLHTFRLIVDYPRWGWDAHREVVLSRDDVDQAYDELGALAATYLRSRELDDWAATPGSWCARCPAVHKCPIPATDRGVGAIETNAAAQLVAEQLVPLQEYVAARKKALRAWAAEAGPLRVGDREWGFDRQRDSWTVIDRDALRAAMDTAGIAFEEHFKPRPGATVFTYHKPKAEC